MVSYRNFSACIMVDGKPLPEYLVTVDANANKVECWIPSEAGKTFSVQWTDHGTRAHSCGFIYLDGVAHPGRFLNGYGTASREGVRTGPDLERPFMFASTSDQAVPNRDMGTIILKIRLVGMQGARSANSIQQPREPARLQNEVSNNYISYGTERTTYKQCPLTWNVVPHDGTGNRSYVTFVFRYRPIDVLYSQVIAAGEKALL